MGADRNRPTRGDGAGGDLETLQRPRRQRRIGLEIATKHRLGKLGQADGLVAAYPSHLSRLGARELPITGAHALLAGGLAWDHRDPFDRMIAAQAMLEGLPVVTGDEALRALDGLATYW